jgi:membrane-associated phospholipid phosphatase
MFPDPIPGTDHRQSPPATAARWSAVPGPARGYRGRLLAAALGYLLVLGLTGLVFVWTRGGQWLDGRLVPRLGTGGYPRHTALTTPAQALLSFVADPLVPAVLLLGMLLVGALSGRLPAGVAGAAATLGTVAGAEVLKLAIPRPDLAVAGSTVHNSFPSGHVAGAAGLVLAFMRVLPVRARWWFAVPGTAAVSAVAAATMIVNWHRFSDALGAVALASALSCLAATLTGGRAGSRPRPGHRGGTRSHAGGPGGPPARAAGRGRLVWVAGLAATAGTLPVWGAAAALPVDRGLCTAVVAVAGFTALSMVSVACVLHPVDLGPGGRIRGGPAPQRPAPQRPAPQQPAPGWSDPTRSQPGRSQPGGPMQGGPTQGGRARSVARL